MRRRQIAVFSVVSAFAVSGCAALSLFSQTHHHTHGTPEIERRLHAVETRVAMLEARLAAIEGVPCDASNPELPIPTP